jgi:hypothetical protein
MDVIDEPTFRQERDAVVQSETRAVHQESSDAMPNVAIRHSTTHRLKPRMTKSGSYLKDLSNIKQKVTEVRANHLRDSILKSKKAPAKVKMHWAKLKLATITMGGALSRKRKYLAIQEEAERELEKPGEKQKGLEGDSTGYKTEGDHSMYEVDNIMRRKALMHDPDIQSVVGEFWNLIDWPCERRRRQVAESFIHAAEY